MRVHIIPVILILVIPFVISFLGFIFVNPRWRSYRQVKWALICLAIGGIVVGAYIALLAVSYKNLTDKHGLKATDFEPYYFAIQTVTTTGYGSALCVCESDSAKPHGGSVKLKGEFHQLATIYMLIWALIVITIGYVVLYIVRQVASELIRKQLAKTPK